MGFVTTISLTTVMVVGVICIYFIKDVQAQMQNAVMALEATPAELTITIPNNQMANSASYISIKLDNGTGQNQMPVLYLMDSVPKISDDYQVKLSATYRNKQLSLKFNSVTVTDAGSYKCSVEASSTIIANCGQLLVIIRKPRPPTVTMLPSSSTVVGSRLELLCETNTNSLPPNHGLESEIWWYDQDGQSIGPSGSGQRVHVSAQRQLVIEPVERTDRSRMFTCASADNTGDVNKRIMSDKSVPFAVIPEYRPSLQDFTINPSFQNGEVIVKKTGDTISYTCEANCWPQCTITWMYKPSSATPDFSELPNMVDRKTLIVIVTRTSQGIYQCKAENKHGEFVVVFTLETLYLEAPTVYINEEGKTSAKVLENTPVNLKCVFDSNPGPVVNWISPSRVMLATYKASGPEVVVDGGVSKRLYTSTHSLTKLKCEDFGIYRCEGGNDINSGEGLMELKITCPPSSAGIIGLELRDDYVWKISESLSFQFVIRAFPAPNITQIVSRLNGVSRPEEVPKDIEITQMLNYDGKPYLTKFDLTSKRVLDRSDADRMFTLTFKASEFIKEFEFQIHPRGPPHEVENLTTINVGHDSLILFWLPGSNGGEPQTFSVEHRVHNPSDDKTGLELYDDSYSWTLASENIADEPPGNWVEVVVGSLTSSTDYVIRVRSTNVLGSSGIGIKVKTAVAPASLGPGAICGIVFAVLIIIAIIVVVILYFLVYRKRFGTNKNGTNRISIIHERLAALFRKDKYASRERDSGKTNGAVPNEGPWARVRKLLKRDSPGNSPNYVYVPPKDYNEDPNVEYDDDNNEEAGVYINTALSPGPRYAAEDNQKSAINNNAVGTKTPDSTRKMNDEGLIYAELEFHGNKKNKKGKDKKKKKKKENINKSNESVNYTDIDFTKTAAQRKELEEAEKRQETEEDNDTVDEDDENGSRQNKYVDAGFGIGTTV